MTTRDEIVKIAVEMLNAANSIVDSYGPGLATTVHQEYADHLCHFASRLRAAVEKPKEGGFAYSSVHTGSREIPEPEKPKDPDPWLATGLTASERVNELYKASANSGFYGEQEWRRNMAAAMDAHAREAVEYCAKTKYLAVTPKTTIEELMEAFRKGSKPSLGDGCERSEQVRL